MLGVVVPVCLTAAAIGVFDFVFAGDDPPLEKPVVAFYSPALLPSEYAAWRLIVAG